MERSLAPQHGAKERILPYQRRDTGPLLFECAAEDLPSHGVTIARRPRAGYAKMLSWASAGHMPRSTRGSLRSEGRVCLLAPSRPPFLGEPPERLLQNVIS